jgi:hypothetical protein
MIRWLGLENEIPISPICPTKANQTAIVLSQKQYLSTGGGKKLWTSEWIDYIKKHRIAPLTENRDFVMHTSSSRTLVVHIRRGDVSPCNNITEFRYLPNSYYIALIQKYQTANHRVIVHSQERSYESWSDFNGFDRLELKLDSTLEETWQDMIEADVYIMSKSSFSLVPALLTNASIVVRPDCHWIANVAQWVTVDRSVTVGSKAKMQELRNECKEWFDSTKYHAQQIGPEQ